MSWLKLIKCCVQNSLHYINQLILLNITSCFVICQAIHDTILNKADDLLLIFLILQHGLNISWSFFPKVCKMPSLATMGCHFCVKSDPYNYICFGVLSGPVFCLLLGVSSNYAQPITGQVTEVTCPVIGWAQPELTLTKRQKTGPVVPFLMVWWNIKNLYYYISCAYADNVECSTLHGREFHWICRFLLSYNERYSRNPL